MAYDLHDYNKRTQAVRARMGVPSGLCAYCAKQEATSWDHVIPKIEGGLDDAFNLVGACTWCNTSKGKRSALEWLLSLHARVTFHKEPCTSGCVRCCTAISRLNPSALPKAIDDGQAEAVVARWPAVVQLDRTARADHAEQLLELRGGG